jgi:hypothetical protein
VQLHRNDLRDADNGVGEAVLAVTLTSYFDSVVSLSRRPGASAIPAAVCLAFRV